MIFPSPRYTVPGFAHLFDDPNHKIIFTPSRRLPIISAFLYVAQCRTVEELFNVNHPHYAYDKRFVAAQDDQLVILHISGTTDYLKPVVWMHSWAVGFIQQKQWSAPPDIDSLNKMQQGTRLLSMLLIFCVSQAKLTLIS